MWQTKPSRRFDLSCTGSGTSHQDRLYATRRLRATLEVQIAQILFALAGVCAVLAEVTQLAFIFQVLRRELFKAAFRLFPYE